MTAEATITKVNPLALGDKYSGNTISISAALPEGATEIKISDDSAKVLLLRWVMWQDKNSNGQLDTGESLPLLSHDRVVYADKAVNVTFQTPTPDMRQTWNFAQGWLRAGAAPSITSISRRIPKPTAAACKPTA